MASAAVQRRGRWATHLVRCARAVATNPRARHRVGLDICHSGLTQNVDGLAWLWERAQGMRWRSAAQRVVRRAREGPRGRGRSPPLRASAACDHITVPAGPSARADTDGIIAGRGWRSMCASAGLNARRGSEFQATARCRAGRRGAGLAQQDKSTCAFPVRLRKCQKRRPTAFYRSKLWLRRNSGSVGVGTYVVGGWALGWHSVR